MVFRRGDLAKYLRRNMSIDLVFFLEANEWNGYRTLQLRVRDLSFEPAYSPDADLDTVPRRARRKRTYRLNLAHHAGAPLARLRGYTVLTRQWVRRAP